MKPTGETMRRLALAVLAHALVIVVWYVVVEYGHVPHYIMPTPLAAVQSLGSETNHWLANTGVTASEIVGGYVIAVIVGIALAIAFTWSPPVEATVMPLLVSLNMVPKVALGPLFIVWFSYGVMPNTIIAFSISFFPILLTTARGFREVEPDLLDLVRSLRGSRWQVFSKIQLPGALPYIFSGMKVGAILAVAGAIVGEFLGSSSGLGYLMLQVQVTLDTASMFMAVILITLIGVVLYGIVLGLEHLLVVRDARVE
jgi:NitT/TauT family transport system permease protein